MEAFDVMKQTREAMTVQRVFGKPIEKDGVTVIPTASIRGGAGGGSSEGPSESGPASGPGSGAGFGLSVRPAGVYVIDGRTVRWQPALDVNRVVVGGQILGIFFLLTLRSFFKRRRKAKAKRR